MHKGREINFFKSYLRLGYLLLFNTYILYSVCKKFIICSINKCVKAIPIGSDTDCLMDVSVKTVDQQHLILFKYFFSLIIQERGFAIFLQGSSVDC